MAEYAIQIARSAEKEIENLPANVLQRVTQKIDQLAVTLAPGRMRQIAGGPQSMADSSRQLSNNSMQLMMRSGCSM